MSVYEKLLSVQTGFRAPKSQYNQFGKYKYRSAEDILEAVKPVCKSNKSVIYLSDKVVFVEGRHYIEATAFFVDLETGESVSVTANAREDESKKGMDGAQLSGATSSYARKYALNGLLDVDDCKDSDEMDGVEAKTAELKHVDTIPLCEQCGKAITPVRKRDGSMWGPKDIAEYSKLQYDGKVFCADCIKARGKNG
uniref:ErF superfamily protein n=1 Tax=Dulem virus 33 TaxID=3145751 RepID=A0AAU8B7Q8_9CAUD